MRNAQLTQRKTEVRIDTRACYILFGCINIKEKSSKIHLPNCVEIIVFPVSFFVDSKLNVMFSVR